jgi:PAS domain-containing protein
MQSEELLKKNIRQHELLSEISYIFNTNSPIANKSTKVLELLGQFTNSSRVYIFENFPEKGITCNTFEWCNKGITPQQNNLQEVPLDMVMSWTGKNEYFTSNDLANELSPDLAEIMISQGIESFIIFPIQVSGEIFGFIGFDECSYPRVWEKHEISLLKTISNIVSFAFERERITSQLKRNEVLYRGLTEKLPQIVFEVTSTGRVSFLNKAGTKFFGISPETLAKGIHLWDLFPIREVYRMKDMLSKITESADFKSVNLNTSVTYNNIKPLNIYFRPILDEQGTVSFSGLALPVLEE